MASNLINKSILMNLDTHSSFLKRKKKKYDFHLQVQYRECQFTKK